MEREADRCRGKAPAEDESERGRFRVSCVFISCLKFRMWGSNTASFRRPPRVILLSSPLSTPLRSACMPTAEADPATQPFFLGTDQRDPRSDETDSIRLRSPEHAEQRHRVTDKVRPASDYCGIPVRDTEPRAYCHQRRRGALAAARPSRRTLVVLALAVVLLSISSLRYQSTNSLLSTSLASSARYNKECAFGHASSCSSGLKSDRVLACRCDPYAQHGVLRISLDDWSGNRWVPTLATDCQPHDYLSQIYRDGRNLSNEPGLDFLRHRVILLFGDSVDRG